MDLASLDAERGTLTYPKLVSSGFTEYLHLVPLSTPSLSDGYKLRVRVWGTLWEEKLDMNVEYGH